MYIFCDLGLYEPESTKQYEPADWQHVNGIDDAAYSPQNIDNYHEAVDYCKRNGGKVFEPIRRTNNPVLKWLKEKDSSNNIGLGIIWSKNQSQFQYQSNGRRISWSNFLSPSITNTSCGKRACLDDDATVVMEPLNGKWIVKKRSEKYGYIFCETAVS